jgi:abortive infection bacteriophage resistance protein
LSINLRAEKPKKTAQELVTLLREEKGVTFSVMSEEAAINYLSKRNNYLRTASYRKNYPKYRQTENKGKYINLDFAYLVELSTIDHHLRTILLKMCINIEHAMKVMLVETVSQAEREDGYQIIDDFIRECPSVLSDIAKKADAVFTKDLINKYFDICYVIDEGSTLRTDVLKSNCPIWVFMEIIDFGMLTRFYQFCIKRGLLSSNQLPTKVLNPVRSLRNACAHNNCLLNNLEAASDTAPPEIISQFVASLSDIPKVGRKKKLSCRPILEIVSMLYAYKNVVSSGNYDTDMKELKVFADDRMMKNIVYFSSNLLVTSSLEFLQKTIDNLI